ncbi:MAG: hypothetical protein V2A78_03510 [bacterium]
MDGIAGYSTGMASTPTTDSASIKAKETKSTLLKVVAGIAPIAGGILGGIIGFCVGGPVGAMLGAGLGMAAGNLAGGLVGQKASSLDQEVMMDKTAPMIAQLQAQNVQLQQQALAQLAASQGQLNSFGGD